MDEQEIKAEFIDDCDIKPTLIDVNHDINHGDEYTHYAKIKTEFPVIDEVDINKNKETLPRQMRSNLVLDANKDVVTTNQYGLEDVNDFGIQENKEPISAQSKSYIEADFEEAFSKISRYLNIEQDLLNKKNILLSNNNNNNNVSKSKVVLEGVILKDAEVIVKDILLDDNSGIKVVLKVVTVVLERLNLDSELESLIEDTRRKNSLSSNNQQYVCKICHFKFEDEDVLRNHQVLHSRQEGYHRIKCVQCNYWAPKPYILRQHMRVHAKREDLQFLKCNICDKELSGRNSLRNHISLHHGDPAKISTYVCDICGFIGRNKGNYRNHIKSHLTADQLDETYQCYVCGYVMKHKGQLISHLESHRNTYRKHSCDFCPFKSNNEKRLQVHMLGHTQFDDVNDREVTYYRCQLCLYQTKEYGNICRHRFTHIERNKATGKYHCQKCSFICVQKQHIVHHLKNAHKVPHVRKVHQCRHCPYHTIHITDFSRHTLRHKSEDEVEMFQCAHCDFKTRLKQNIWIHYRNVHRPDLKPTHKCTECSFETKYKYMLQRHVLFVHEEDPVIRYYDCPQCPYKSINSNHVKMHIQSKHSKTVWYYCDKCSFRSRYESSIKAHNLNLHEKKLKKCRKCQYKTKSEKFMKRHQKHRHKNEMTDSE